jgi:hypothetical protein
MERQSGAPRLAGFNDGEPLRCSEDQWFWNTSFCRGHIPVLLVSEAPFWEGFRNRLYPPEERQVTLDRKAPPDVQSSEQSGSRRHAAKPTRFT